jgi:hypothetical protein
VRASRDLALYVGLHDSPAVVLRKFRAAQAAARASERRIAVLAERLRKGGLSYREACRTLRRAA